MERRSFLHNSLVFATLSSFYKQSDIFANPSEASLDSSANLLDQNQIFWIINTDGSFNLNIGNFIIKNCYPTIDNTPIKPVKIQIQKKPNGGIITYTLAVGELIIILGKDSNSHTIDCQISGFDMAPHWVYPIGYADISQAARFFKQGLGFGGPSGMFDIAKAGFYHDQNNLIEKAWSYDSYMTTGVQFDEKTNLAIGAYNHKDFLQRTTIYNHIHRQLLIDKFPDTENIFFESGFGTENIPIAGKVLTLPSLHIVTGNTMFGTLKNLAQNIANQAGARKKFPPRLHWDSWYEYFGDYDYKKLDDFLSGLKNIEPKIPFHGILIDAGWSPLGDWLLSDEKDYPGGIKNAFKRITDEGYVPGVFIGAFMVSSASKLYKQHPDWMLRDNNGNIMIESKGRPSFDNRSLYDERYFLDTSHPGAFEYLRSVFRTFKEWGVKFYKTDFHEWGLKDSTKVKRYTPGKTGAQYMYEVNKMIREEAGDDTFWLGCIAPFQCMIGFSDAIRVSYDTDGVINANTINLYQETIATQYFNTILFQNDPDVMFLRSDPATMQKNGTVLQTEAYWMGMLGGTISLSDRMHKLFPERLQLLHFCRPGKKFLPADMPFWYDKRYQSANCSKYFKEVNAYAFLVINYKEEPIKETFSIKEITGNESAMVYDWAPQKSIPIGKLDKLEVTLNYMESKLFYISLEGKAPSEKLGLSGEETLN
ncbi:MAG: glycoside hydrolase family 36 protein [Cytophagales bacterium]|nr:glycoside hydrolase family 36 protein [Cytophagales bacterium]